MASFFSVFNSVSSSKPPVSATALATAERKRAATLREQHTSHPLVKWDTDHVCAWLQHIELPLYVPLAQQNLVTGSSLLRAHRNHTWDNAETCLGIASAADLQRIRELFDKRRRQVIVRVYDVTGGLGARGKSALLLVNKIFRNSLGGAYHCGVEVWGMEWAFGDGGVYCTYPKREIMGHHFREVVVMPHDSESAMSDRCLLDQREVRTLCEAMKPMWPGSRYDLVHCNCCHFADALCKALGMGTIPGWINRAARIGAGADISWLSGNVPTVKGSMKGSKEDEQAKAMYDSATQLFKDGLITRAEYQNLREKHSRYVEEVMGKSGPIKKAQIQIQTSSVVTLAHANKEVEMLLEQGRITRAEYDTIVQAHGDAGDAGEVWGPSNRSKKLEHLLGIGDKKVVRKQSCGEHKETVIELEL